MPRSSPRKAISKPAAAEATVLKESVAITNGSTTKSVSVTKTKVALKKPAPKKRQSRDEDDFECDSHHEDEDKKPAKRRKTAGKKQANMVPPSRTAVGSLKKAMYIGAHVSAAGGVHNSIQNSVNIGANAFAVFLRSHRKWTSPPLADDAKWQFRRLAEEHDYDVAKYCVPHGSYLVNLAQSDADKAAQAYANFVDDLGRCEALGIGLYNFHPGSTLGAPRAEALGRIAAQLNRAHRATAGVATLVENMAGGGNVLGGRFEDLRDIIAGVDDKARVGVCLDTCHAFAAGYDLRTPAAFAATLAEFDRVVGLRYLRALHLNDSKAPLGSRRDLHANIGTGFLGLRAFHSIVNHAAFAGLPMVLETPTDRRGPDGRTVEDTGIWAEEIKLLESLVGMDADGDAFRAREAELRDRGAEERQKIQGQVDKKAEKESKKGKGRAKKKKAESTDEEDSD